MYQNVNRPRPRLPGNENPALVGVDAGIKQSPGLPSEQGTIPKKLSSGAVNARKSSVLSARSMAAQRMKKG